MSNATRSLAPGVEELGGRKPPKSSTLLAVAGGMLLLQLVWLFVVPPFRGSDEFDHVYRAAAAARGQLFVEPTDATRGTGAWLEVPKDIVDAAKVQCKELPYTSDVDCVGTPQGNDVRIASGAGRYHPLYYALVGGVALPFDGIAAMYAMRLGSMILCAAMFLLAIVSTRRWARTSWPLAAVAVACTPVLIYSTAIVAPNGLEMMAGITLWTSLVGLLSVRRDQQAYFAAASAIAALTLATLRPLGPIWCVLIGLHVLVAVWPSRSRLKKTLLSTPVLVTVGITALAILHALIYVAVTRALQIGAAPRVGDSWFTKIANVAADAPLWILQSVAAFPLRNEPSHHVVYVAYLMIFLSLVVAALLRCRGRLRTALVATTFTAVAFPFITSLQSYEQFRGAWQGRYGLPFAVGIVVLAGLALDRRGRAPDQRSIVLAGFLFSLAHLVGPTLVLIKEGHISPLAGTDAWLQPSPLVAAPAAAIAAITLWYGAVRAKQEDPSS